MSTLALMFAGINENQIPELTEERTMASVPFGCRYRLIDFSLSNVVNAGIADVAILTSHNYQSLMDHLGSGKEWDLARRHGGLHILPPFFTMMNRVSGNGFAASGMETLLNARGFLEDRREDLVLLCNCDRICNIDLNVMIQKHKDSGADLTLAVKRTVLHEKQQDVAIVHSDRNGKIVEVADGNDGSNGKVDISMQYLVIDRRLLLNLLTEMSVHGFSNFSRDFLTRNAKKYDFRIFRYECYFGTMESISDYYTRSMELLRPEIRAELLEEKNRPIFTKVHNSVPATYRDGCMVKNSLIADGCVIEGIVENSIISRGVHVGKNTSIENCIIMQDTIIGDNVYLNCVVTDKNVVIRDGRVLSGHESRPFYINKNAEV